MLTGLTFIKKFKSAYDKGTRYEAEARTGDVLGVALLVSLLALGFGMIVILTSADLFFIGLVAVIGGAIASLLVIASAYMTEDHEKTRKVPALKVFGWIGIFFWIFMMVAMLYYVFTIDPAVAAYYGMTNAPFWEVFMIVITFVIGAAVYAVFKWRNKRRGIDVGTIYSEIPPE